MFSVNAKVTVANTDGSYNTYRSAAPKWDAESAEVAMTEVLDSLTAHVKMGREVVYREATATPVN